MEIKLNKVDITCDNPDDWIDLVEYEVFVETDAVKIGDILEFDDIKLKVKKILSDKNEGWVLAYRLQDTEKT